MNYKIYVASPLGFLEIGRDSINNFLIPKLSRIPGIEMVNPWRGLDVLSESEIVGMARDLTITDAMGSANINLEDIDTSDMVLAILDGIDVDSGVAAEMGYAYARGKKIVGYRGDFRLSADTPVCRVNLQVEFLVRMSGGEMFAYFEDVIRYLSNPDNLKETGTE